MFGTFLEDSDYTLQAVIDELKDERNSSMLVKASMDYLRYAHQLAGIIGALERVRDNETKLRVAVKESEAK